MRKYAQPNIHYLLVVLPRSCECKNEIKTQLECCSGNKNVAMVTWNVVIVLTSANNYPNLGPTFKLGIQNENTLANPKRR